MLSHADTTNVPLLGYPQPQATSFKESGAVVKDFAGEAGMKQEICFAFSLKDSTNKSKELSLFRQFAHSIQTIHMSFSEQTPRLQLPI
jgi:hypothetical protein